MIYKFTQAETKQSLLIASAAITAVDASPSDGRCYVHTLGGVAFEVLGTVEQIEALIFSHTSMSTVAIAPIGG